MVPGELPPPEEGKQRKEGHQEDSPASQPAGLFCRRFSPCLGSTPQTAETGEPPAEDKILPRCVSS